MEKYLLRLIYGFGGQGLRIRIGLLLEAVVIKSMGIREMMLNFNFEYAFDPL